MQPTCTVENALYNQVISLVQPFSRVTRGGHYRQLGFTVTSTIGKGAFEASNSVHCREVICIWPLIFEGSLFGSSIVGPSVFVCHVTCVFNPYIHVQYTGLGWKLITDNWGGGWSGRQRRRKPCRTSCREFLWPCREGTLRQFWGGLGLTRASNSWTKTYCILFYNSYYSLLLIVGTTKSSLLKR